MKEFIKCQNGHILGELKKDGTFTSKHRRRIVTVRADGEITLECGQCGKIVQISTHYHDGSGDGE